MPDTSFPSFPGSRHGWRISQLAAPAQDIESVIRDAKKQQRGECSQRAAAAGAKLATQGRRAMSLLDQAYCHVPATDSSVLTCFLTFSFCIPGDPVGFLVTSK